MKAWERDSRPIVFDSTETSGKEQRKPCKIGIAIFFPP